MKSGDGTLSPTWQMSRCIWGGRDNRHPSSMINDAEGKSKYPLRIALRMQAALVILDGWGISRFWPVQGDRLEVASNAGRDAIAAAETPTYRRLLRSAAVGRLRAEGETVGLPDGHMGNSAVGHLTIGAGRVIEQPSTRIDRAIADDTLAEVGPIQRAFNHVHESESRMHLWGLLSDGGVHSSADHLQALIELADRFGVRATTHIVTDGRDTHPRCARRFIDTLEHTISLADTGEIGSVSGRYYAMDRDENWVRTRRSFEVMATGMGSRVASDAHDAVKRAYSVGESDEFIEPTAIADTPDIEDGDALLMTNFRPDRARQLTRMLAGIDPEWSFEVDPPAVFMTTMTEYDATFDLPVVFEPIEPEVTLGSAIADAGLTQLRIAESEKYPHVTYFINGGREVRYPGELREIVSSPPVPTYDRQPEMSAPQVVDTAISIIEDEDPDVLVLNFANPDMVGHTGDFDATVAAIEAVDRELDRLLGHLRGAHVLIIADHGNADDMGTPANPHTAHTTNPVPCLYLAPDGGDGGRTIRRGGTLADVTPTLLALLEIAIPDEMTGRSLLE